MFWASRRAYRDAFVRKAVARRCALYFRCDRDAAGAEFRELAERLFDRNYDPRLAPSVSGPAADADATADLDGAIAKLAARAIGGDPDAGVVAEDLARFACEFRARCMMEWTVVANRLGVAPELRGDEYARFDRDALLAFVARWGATAEDDAGRRAAMEDELADAERRARRALSSRPARRPEGIPAERGPPPADSSTDDDRDDDGLTVVRGARASEPVGAIVLRRVRAKRRCA